MLKTLNKYFTLILCLFSSQTIWGQSADSTYHDFYERGVSFKEEKDWSKALNTWLEGVRIMKRAKTSDPRLGIAFIELVTEQQIMNYYELACNVYIWGFTNYKLAEFKSEVEKEIERISPLLTEKESKAWHSLLEKNDPEINGHIRSFWSFKDPTPSTKINERLLEHWERIAYARENYRLAKNSVYQTDDRGLIYVKYGKPDRKVKGSLGSKRASFKTWTDVMMNNENTSVLDASGRGSTTSQAERQTHLLNEIDRYNNIPEYELWFYNFLDHGEPITYLFGNRDGIGLFGLRTGVEEFIPSAAFLRSSSFRTGSVSAGAILQSVYYSELMHLHPDFEKRFYELEQIWNTLDVSNKSAGFANSEFRLRRLDFATADHSNRIAVAASAPPDRTNFDKTTAKVELLVTPFRFLQKKNIPSIAFIVSSIPQIKMDFIKLGAEKRFPSYSINHTLLAYDQNGQEIQRLRDVLLRGKENLSTFTLTHKETQKAFKLISEVFEAAEDDEHLAANAAKPTPLIIGVGKSEVQSPAALSSRTDVLELSDLLIGVDSPFEVNMARVPFPVIPSNRIFSTDNLKIYLEIYHLYFDGEGATHYSIDVGVARLKGSKKEKKESISLSFNFDGSESKAIEEFSVDISKLAPARYELSAEVIDKVSNLRKQRTAEFEIIPTQ